MTSLDPEHAARKARLWGGAAPKPARRAPAPPPAPKMAAVKPDVIDAMIAAYKRPTRKDSLPEIIARVAEQHNLEPYQVRGSGRTSPLVAARRQVIWETVHKRPDLSYPAIGRVLGGRDHSTIVHAIASMAKRLGVPYPSRKHGPAK